jgi:predicted GNAT family acetyltransferase
MAIEIEHQPDKERYEISVDGRLVGFTSYRIRREQVQFLETAVDEAHRGQGLAHRLVTEALADVHAQGKTPVGVCPFVAGVLRRQLREQTA